MCNTLDLLTLCQRKDIKHNKNKQHHVKNEVYAIYIVYDSERCFNTCGCNNTGFCYVSGFVPMKCFSLFSVCYKNYAQSPECEYVHYTLLMES